MVLSWHKSMLEVIESGTIDEILNEMKDYKHFKHIAAVVQSHQANPEEYVFSFVRFVLTTQLIFRSPDLLIKPFF
jgi:hypothetical protein